ncbi:MAG: sensor histidine kinase [Bryobacteraceae bacterium]
MSDEMAQSAIIVNVDDNEPARYVRTRVLSAAGFSVCEAATGSEALTMIAERNPDLVLLDVHLPDVHGLEICRQVKSRDASVIVLQISASAIAPPHAVAALESGADAYLTEPVDPDVLVATVKALLRLQRAERDLQKANDRLLILNRDLQRSNEDLQQFAFAASHDLQEPLRTITSFAGLLERTAATKLSAREREYLTMIADGGRRMRGLIDDLLAYSQVGREPDSVEMVDLNAVLSSTLENLHETIAASGAVVTADWLPTIDGNEAQLGHVLQNLIGNAIKYSRPGTPPAIHLTASQEDGEWLIAVRDQGIGIEKEYFSQIFTPFKRLHGRSIPGTGIGLAICRRVIEAHRGKIWLESTVGEGSTFYFTVPVSPESGKL